MVIVGLMSGTSLDGLDIAACRFTERDEGPISYEILAAQTYAYPKEWKDRIQALPTSSAEELVKADWELGAYFGELVSRFLKQKQIHAQVVSSHGHTIFHNPKAGYTCQIGKGASLSFAAGLPVINDFRSMDVAHSGEGAPLVPVGDHFLFPSYDACLNLGGIANISYLSKEGKRLAFDIGYCNMVLNYLAATKGLEYDKDGWLASKGNKNEELYKQLSEWSFFGQPAPKSLAREQIEAIYGMLNANTCSLEDKLNTACLVISDQILKVCKAIQAETLKEKLSILVTGGGAHNSYLMSLLQQSQQRGLVMILPERLLIDFKEALIFAFLGFLRISKRFNSLAEVTGASRDNIGGSVVGGFI